jgi:Zn-dependent M28 family amino/carboxypeptidase
VRRGPFTALAVLTLTGVLLIAPAAPAVETTDSSALRSGVTVSGVMDHEKKFQQIANQNDGTRVSGTEGFDDSADYVAGRLRRAGYQVSRQVFDFAFFQENATPQLDQVSPTPTVYQHGVDFSTMDYSGSGNPTAPLVATNDIVIPPGATASTSNSGCEISDFPANTAGSIVLIQRGTCDFVVKARNAQSQGAVGVIIFNEGQANLGRDGLLFGTLGSPEVTIPVTGTTFALGEALYNQLQDGPVTMHMFTDTTSEIRTTENVFGVTPGGRADREVVVGAHLDSVAAGPGINDNGSGVSTILEIAEEMSELGVQPVNKVRFAFWGAEESGLIGSEHYVASLSKRQLNNISVNLNFDMVGSPNFVRFVYDGDGDETGTKGPSGSAAVEDVFVDYFAARGMETDPTAFDGRSDYGPFIAVGIPAGGLFTGAEGIKTAAQAAIYGGTAGVAYDPCYHQACDTITNVNTTAINQMSDAVAHATLVFALTRSDVSATEGGTGGPDMEFKGPRAKQ